MYANWASWGIRHIAGANVSWCIICARWVKSNGDWYLRGKFKSADWHAMIETSQPLPWPGFEPGLSRPQREVLTTIRSRPFRQLIDSPFKTHGHPSSIDTSAIYVGGCLLPTAWDGFHTKVYQLDRNHKNWSTYLYFQNTVQYGTIIGAVSNTPIPGGLVVRIRRSHRRGRGSIPRLGMTFS